MNLGLEIRKTRKAQKINQQELSIRTGLSQAYISQVENGHKKPSQDAIETICGVLGTHAGILYWNSLTEQDVSEDKRTAFRIIKPSVDRLLQKIN